MKFKRKDSLRLCDLIFFSTINICLASSNYMDFEAGDFQKKISAI